MTTMTSKRPTRTTKVSDIEDGRIDRLAREIAPVLREQGHVLVSASEIESVDQWRRAARKAGRILGWRVTTKVSADGSRVFCVSDDFPVPPGAGRDAAVTFERLLRGDA